MSRLLILVVLGTIALAFAWSPASDGTLEQIRAATRGGGGGGGSSNRGGGGGGFSASSPHDADTDSFGDVVGKAIIEQLSEWWAFRHDTDNVRLVVTNYYYHFPYEQGQPGYIFRQWQRDPDSTPTWYLVDGTQSANSRPVHIAGGAPFPALPPFAKQWAVTFSADDSHDSSSKLNTARFELRIEHGWGIGFETSWAYLHESLADGATDQLGLADFNIYWNFITQPIWRMRVGGGGANLLDGRNSHGGGNFMAGFDVFPLRPIIISGYLDLGEFDAHIAPDVLVTTHFQHYRLTAGAVINRFELYGGYDYLQIGPVCIRGPVAGVRVWF